MRVLLTGKDETLGNLRLTMYLSRIPDMFDLRWQFKAEHAKLCAVWRRNGFIFFIAPHVGVPLLISSRFVSSHFARRASAFLRGERLAVGKRAAGGAE